MTEQQFKAAQQEQIKQQANIKRSFSTMTRYEVTLKDALNNFAPDSGASDEYCKGMLVGLVSGLIAKGLSWRDAIGEVKTHLPHNSRKVTESNCPESWVKEVQQ